MLSYLNPNNNSAELGQDEENEHFTQDLDINTNDNFSESVDLIQKLIMLKIVLIYRNIRNSGESANVNLKTDNVEQSSSGNILDDKLDESVYPEVVDNCTAQTSSKTNCLNPNITNDEANNTFDPTSLVGLHLTSDEKSILLKMDPCQF